MVTTNPMNPKITELQRNIKTQLPPNPVPSVQGRYLGGMADQGSF